MRRTAASTILYCILLSATACGRDGPTTPSGEGWLLEQVAEGLDMGLQSSVTTTSDGTVHLALFDQRAQALRYATRTPTGAWTITRLDSIGWVGRDVAIHADQGDTLHLAYQDNWNDDLMYARGVGGTWTYERLNPTAIGGSSPQFAPAPDGLYLADSDDILGRFRMRRGGLGAWNTLGDVSVERASRYFGLAVLPDGPRLLVLSDTGGRGSPPDEGTLLLVRPNASGFGWQRQALLEGRFSSVSLAAIADDGGGLHLLYVSRDGILHDLGNPHVDTGVSYGTVRVRTGPGDTIWTLYASGSDLVISRRLPAGSWERLARVRRAGALGRWDLHVDPAGAAHISFYSPSQQRLWYGRWGQGP